MALNASTERYSFVFDGNSQQGGPEGADGGTRSPPSPTKAALSGLSHYLPGFVDELIPDGRLPTDAEAERLI